MKKILPIIIAIIAIAAIWFGLSRVLMTSDEETAGNAVGTQEYSSGEWLFAFEYPDSYGLIERDLSTPQRGHLSLVLADKSFVSSEGGEGPISINVDVYQNAKNEGYTAESWIKGNSASNYKLGPGDITTRTVGGHEAFEYSWSGLYEGESVVVATADYMYMFSVTRDGKNDPILTDFDGLLESVRIGSF